MYRLDRRARKHHRIAAGTIAVILLVGVGIFIYKSLHLTTAPQSKISNASGIVSRYDPPSSAKVPIDEPLFTMALPKDWKRATAPDNIIPRPTYYYVSPSADARQLAVYIGTMPTQLALNKVVTVTGEGNTFNHEDVSDNCVSYTQPSKSDPNSGTAIGKWHGVEFLCDLGNYTRNLVGTASTEGINQVTLRSPMGSQKVFLTFNDNGGSPDYTVFYAILDSFKLK